MPEANAVSVETFDQVVSNLTSRQPDLKIAVKDETLHESTN
jgi:hypothetical protein